MLFSMIMRRYCVFKRWKLVCAILEILAILIFDCDHSLIDGNRTL